MTGDGYCQCGRKEMAPKEGQVWFPFITREVSDSLRIMRAFRDAERALLAHRASPEHTEDDARERELETARDLAVEDFKRLAREM